MVLSNLLDSDLVPGVACMFLRGDAGTALYRESPGRRCRHGPPPSGSGGMSGHRCMRRCELAKRKEVAFNHLLSSGIIPLESLDHFSRRIVAGGAGDAATRMRARTAEEEIFYGRAVAAPTGDGPHD